VHQNAIVWLGDLVGKFNLTLADIDFLVKGHHLQRLDPNKQAHYRVLTNTFEQYTMEEDSED